MTSLDLGYDFQDADLLLKALTHSSFVSEHGGTDNERLEFLGDSIFNSATTTLLYSRYPEATEGELSHTRATLVDTTNLAAIARRLKLAPHLRLGRGEVKQGGRERESTLENAVEAVLGAIFLDSDFPTCQALVAEWLAPELSQIRQLGRDRRRQMKNPKGVLQEFTERHLSVKPTYVDVSEEGPAHDRTFVVAVHLKGDDIAQGTGSTKKQAEKAAATLALTRVRRELERP